MKLSNKIWMVVSGLYWNLVFDADAYAQRSNDLQKADTNY